ncbi:hypothetical protein [Leptospira kirschneri]|uniref:Uncharacterized protein n=1 Tax=Leptospira kirschneri serovar Bulgarica str. Nikolaevo TaxID=1240687 RepID=M6F0U1_9LEPT|nr:hypothetical protein [Leptospira kirschneri]EMK22383.1 hypothetical protein LEP1GSC008_1570 [Leptospira kirschneri serovar Bulgarica str. Nikolaevo]EMK24545.1 hypothetical protein LEP1GSC008_2643 [Leptospira kirschneri serovar Bulgarica str. Nikolaevo]EMK24858.1 hypothetical protein LEP1GSC008_0587 [Leptospira kirschneri serovar Bulgarica str. Nikolaevo]
MIIQNSEEIKRAIAKRGFLRFKEWSDSKGLNYNYAVKTLNGQDAYSSVVKALEEDKFKIVWGTPATKKFKEPA